MRMVYLDKIAAGKQLARSIHGADGQVLLHAGVTLTEKFVARLLEKGYRSVYICDEFTRGIVVDEIISEETRLKATQAVKDTMERFERGETIDSLKIKNSVHRIIEELQSNSGILAGLSAIRSFDDYTFAHSVNVCTLSLVLGISLYYDYDQLCELGVGAMLHDIGKTQVPVTILQKAAKLTEEEWLTIKKHPDFGFDILRQNFDISLLSAHIAFQHHERNDGSGYPRGLKAGDILDIAKITAITDVFDAITSDRVYRPRLPLNKAYNVMLEAAGTQFERQFIRRFLDRVVLYPNGTIVRLNTGQIGVIARQEEQFNYRPAVRLITDRYQRQLLEWQEVRLTEKPEMEIVEVLNDYPFAVPDHK